MGGGQILSASLGKTREAWKKATSTARELQAQLTRSARGDLDKIAYPRFVSAAPFILIAIALGTAVLLHSFSPPQVVSVSQEATADASLDVSPSLGGEEAGWRELWSPSPTATSVARLMNPSTPSPSPLPPATASDYDRPLLAARSNRTEEAKPTPAPARPLTFEEQFIAQAVEAAQASQRETGVPASVTIAQAILESDWGRSALSVQAKNYFGIKATAKGGSAGVVWMSTWEVINGQNVTVRAPFRAYKSMADSFTDHGRFFTENDRYASAMRVVGDAIAFAREIHRAGYATDPAYSDKLIGLINKFGLLQYDLR